MVLWTTRVTHGNPSHGRALLLLREDWWVSQMGTPKPASEAATVRVQVIDLSKETQYCPRARFRRITVLITKTTLLSRFRPVGDFAIIIGVRFLICCESCSNSRINFCSAALDPQQLGLVLLVCHKINMMYFQDKVGSKPAPCNCRRYVNTVSNLLFHPYGL
jgi:hypothetical protein